MKKIFFYFFIFIYLIIKGKCVIEYDLENMKLLKQSYPVRGANLKFYIKSLQNQEVIFNFYLENSYKRYNIIQEVFFYEYLNRNSKDTLYEKKVIIEKKKVNSYFYCIPYKVNNSETNYVALEFKLDDTHIPNMEVKAEVLNNKYNISSGEPKIINDVMPGGIYAFYIPVKEEQIVYINFTTNKVQYPPIFNSFITEYDSFNDPIHTSNNQKIYFTTELFENQTILKSSYIVSVDGNKYGQRSFFVRLEIDVTSLDYFMIEMNVFTKEFNLTEGVEHTFYDLKAGYFYYFFLEATIKQTLRINMNMNNMTNLPFSEIYIYELTANKETLIKEKENILFYGNDTQLTISPIFYQIKKLFTYYKALRIQTSYDIEYLKILIETDGKTFALKEGESNIFYNLRKGNNYYFYLNGGYLNFVTINITLNDLNVEALTDLYIFESKNKETIYERTSQSISFSNINNTLVATNLYRIKNSQTSEISLKLSPIYNINSMNISFDIQQGIFYLIDERRKIFNLRDKLKYYFLPSEEKLGYEFSFNLITDYKKNKPYNLNFYNCEGRLIHCKNKKIKVNYKIIANESVSSFTFRFPNYEYGYYSYIELIPNYFINYMVVELKRKSTYYNSKDFLILLMVIPCIFVVLIILAILDDKKIKSYKQINKIRPPLHFPLNPNNINN